MYLGKVADTIDNLIAAKAKNTIDAIVAKDPPKEGVDPFNKIKNILARANVERQKANEEMKNAEEKTTQANMQLQEEEDYLRTLVNKIKL